MCVRVKTLFSEWLGEWVLAEFFNIENLPEVQETPSTEAQKPAEQPEKKDENVSEPSSFISAAKTEVIVSMVNDVNGVNAQKDNGVHNHISSLF